LFFVKWGLLDRITTLQQSQPISYLYIYCMLSVGLVGLPNAGKSTLFNLLTKRSVPAENFPFCTIDPHDGIVEVPDSRVKTLSDLSKSQKEVYAAIEFRDIAGLVKNASQGAGLGNQFLSHIKEVDLILMVVRAFHNDDIIHVENRVNPKEDEEILLLELGLADQKMLENILPRLEKDLKSSKDKFLGEKIEIIEKILASLTNLGQARDVLLPNNTDPEVVKWRKGLNLLTDKPVLRLANISQEKENMFYESDFELDILLESSLSDMTKAEREELGVVGESGLDRMIQACYQKLNLGTFLTTGEAESRAWTFTKGMTGPQSAGVIHTDFEKKYIKAEVIRYEDYIECGSRKVAIEKGKMRTEGKDYLMLDGDVVEFKIGV
jgi:ribosome-binding ATPase